MPKNAVKPEAVKLPQSEGVIGEAAEPYSEKTSLGGPIFKVGSYGTMPCRVQLSSKILTAANLKPRDQVQVISEAGQIIIRKIGDPRQGYSIPSSKPRPELDEFLADMKKRSNPPEWEEEEEPDPLNEDQVSREEL